MERRRVLLFGGFDLGAGYPRAGSLIQALTRAGVEVSVLRESILPARGLRACTISQPWRWPGALGRLWSGERRLRNRLRGMIAEHRFDVVLVPYPGWFSVRDARRVFDGPVVLDLFFSLSDTVVGDRRLFRPGGAVERFLRRVDRRACLAADRVLLDTPAHAVWMSDFLDLDEERFGWVPIGDPAAPATATPPRELQPGEPLRVLYVGTGVPLHGVATILAACARTDGVRLSFIGGTVEHRREAAALGPDTVVRIERWVKADELGRLYREHDVVFGVFGDSGKAGRVVPFKVVHTLAHGRTAITAETRGVQSLLAPGSDCLTVPAADIAALARALVSVRDAPGLLRQIAPAARRRYESTFSPAAVGDKLLAVFEEVTGEAWRSTAIPCEEGGAAEVGSPERIAGAASR